MEELTNAVNHFNESFNSFKTFMEHPFINTGKWLLTVVVIYSKPVCLFGASTSLILYILGLKKFGKYIGFFCLLYFLIQCIGLVL